MLIKKHKIHVCTMAEKKKKRTRQVRMLPKFSLFSLLFPTAFISSFPRVHGPRLAAIRIRGQARADLLLWTGTGGDQFKLASAAASVPVRVHLAVRACVCASTRVRRPLKRTQQPLQCAASPDRKGGRKRFYRGETYGTGDFPAQCPRVGKRC